MSTIHARNTRYPARHFITVSVLFLVSCTHVHVFADDSRETADRVVMNATWDGLWISPTRGSIYAAEFHLHVDSMNAVQGHIKWTLKRSPHESERKKIGMTGVEYVSGTYDPRCRILSIDGKGKDDPHTILGLDKYRLILAENQKALGGITESHGTWRGMLSLG